MHTAAANLHAGFFYFQLAAVIAGKLPVHLFFHNTLPIFLITYTTKRDIFYYFKVYGPALFFSSSRCLSPLFVLFETNSSLIWRVGFFFTLQFTHFVTTIWTICVLFFKNAL
jgi:hypothetical protein